MAKKSNQKIKLLYYQKKAIEIMDNVSKVIVGKEDVTKLVLTSLIAGGHVLLEDVPGTGKTMLAKTVAKSVDAQFSRIQFTPDLLPSDVTGINYYNQKAGEFVFRRGPVFSNILLADEINRTSSKTQAALLEVMEEGKVTVDGRTRHVPEPFIVIATQNPIGSVGTTMLPESQLDRFMFRLDMGYPDKESEVAMIQSRQGKTEAVQELKPIINCEDLLFMQQEVNEVFVHEEIVRYIVNLVDRTRTSPDIELGVSPRGTLALVKAAKAYAYMEGRNYVVPDDVKNVFFETVNHRIILSGHGKSQGVKMNGLVENILRTTPVEQGQH